MIRLGPESAGPGRVSGRVAAHGFSVELVRDLRSFVEAIVRARE